MFIFNIFFVLIGVGIGFIEFYTVVLFTPIFQPICPSINGRTCNHRGICRGSVCECLPTYSGQSCEQTRCPGYRPDTGNVCLGRGVCSPLMNTSDIPEVCREIGPSEENGYVRSGPGWGSVECVDYINKKLSKFDQGDYSDLAGVPTCACHSPYGGLSCGIDMCPMNSEFQVCSGNGNTSVGHVFNGTRVGLGCQCTSYTKIGDLAKMLTRTQINTMVGDHLNDFKLGFCGSAILTGYGTLLFAQPKNALKCFCDEKHYGEICQHGVCPAVNDVFCSGHGNPAMGFGYEADTNINRNEKCQVICKPPKVMCKGACQSSCGHSNCGAGKPWRCATGTCVKGDSVMPMFETATWDDLSALPGGRINCSQELWTKLKLPALRQRYTERCFGEGATQTRFGFQSVGGVISFPSRLLSLKITASGQVNMTWGGVKHSYDTSPIVFKDTKTEDEVYRERYQLTENIVQLEILGNRVHVTPDPHWWHPTEEYFYFEKEGGGEGEILGKYMQSMITKDTKDRGDAFIAYASGSMALSPRGDLVPGELCFSGSQCIWRKNQSGLCTDDGVYYKMTGCDGGVVNDTGLVWVRTTMVASTGVTSSFSTTGNWTVSLRRDVPWHLTIIAGQIHEIEYLLQSDIQLKNVCPPYGTNHSELNVEWNQEGLFRPEAKNKGEYLVTSRIVKGHRIETRGVIKEGYVIDHYLREKIANSSKTLKLTKAEYKSGTPDADLDVFASRCKDGFPTMINLTKIENVGEDCACKVTKESKLQCICKDSFSEVVTCQDDQCRDGWKELLEERCTWSPYREPGPIKGFQSLGGGVWMLNDSHPLIIHTDGCAVRLLNAEEYDFTCVEGGGRGKLIPRLIGLDESRIWLVETEGSFQTEYSMNYGGISILKTNYSMFASSGNARLAADYGRERWESGDDGRAQYIGYETNEGHHFTCVYLDITDAGIVTGERIIAVKIYIQVNMGDDVTWKTIGVVTSGVVNGTQREVIDVASRQDEAGWYTKIRVMSHFPLSLRSFIPYVNQNCTGGKLTGKWKEFQYVTTTDVVNQTCTCNDSCVLDGQMVGSNGICEDMIGVPEGMVGEVCTPGTDCSDCGSSTRQFRVNPMEVCQSQERVTVGDYLTLGLAESFLFNYTANTKQAWRWIKSQCIEDCPFYTCKDGSCRETESKCEETRYSCPGDGCVRADVNHAEYKCACERGWGGIRCEFTQCAAGDPETGLVNPHIWCTCNGPSPLRLKQPFELILGRGYMALTDTDILERNRPGGRSGAMDVGWVNIRAEKAPFGTPFLRLYTRNEKRFYTNCPYRVASQTGQFYELEECVGSRSTTSPHWVTSWVNHSSGEVFEWTSETQYDDTPYRCPTGHCVREERDCYSWAKREPMCGGPRSLCLVDGTCRCPYGLKTFLFTEEFTEHIVVPYSHKGSVMETTRWGRENNNRYTSEWCRAKNCTEVDCSPPTGCFPGSKELDFVDRRIKCPGIDKCAVDVHDCKSGRVTNPLPCSGNGELRLLDYTEGEYRCDCGARVNGVFVKNGFGGVACNDYSCQDDPSRVYYAAERPHVFQSFLDHNLIPLPGRWMGPCGVSTGANPDDIAIWNQCCQGMKQLERCTMVPCIIGGVPTCTKISECLGANRTPMVYPCNGKGKPLADGTCLCDRSVETGVGYTYDLSVYSTEGCFVKVRCSAAVTTGKVCNRKSACSDISSWPDFPVIPYLEQQVYIWLIQEGLPATPEWIVRKVLVDDVDDVILQTYVLRAVLIQSEIAALQTDVCVYPNDDPANPQGMVPYPPGSLTYKKAILATHVITYDNDGREYLNDDISVSTRSRYKNMYAGRKYGVFLSGQTIGIGFQEKRYIDIVRVHMYTNETFTIEFRSRETGSLICQPMEVEARGDYDWNDIFCMPLYTAVRFDLLYPYDYRSICKGNINSILCQTWMVNTCKSIPLAHLNEPGNLIEFTGCNNELCCLASHASFDDAFNVDITLGGYAEIDEMIIYGHKNTVLSLPTGLQMWFDHVTGQSECIDEILFQSSDANLKGNLAMFNPAEYDINGVHIGLGDRGQSRASCEEYGGVLASVVTTPTAGMEAEELGMGCFDNAVSANPGCFVDADDSSNIKHPVDDMTHLFDLTCLTHGCYQLYSNTETYHTQPRPLSESQHYDSQWNGPGHVPWNYMFGSIETYINYQRTMFAPVRYSWYQFNTVHPVPAEPYLTTSNAYAEHFAKVKPTQYIIDHPNILDYDYRSNHECYNNDCYHRFQTKTTTVNYIAEQRFWLKPETCTVILYSMYACGALETNPCAEYTTRGAWYVFQFVPNTYEELINTDDILLDLNGQPRTFDTCDPSCYPNFVIPYENMPTIKPTNINDGTLLYECCKFFGEPISKAKSIAIQGNCKVRFKSSTNQDVEFTRKTETSHRAFFQYAFTAYFRKNIYIDGCYSNYRAYTGGPLPQTDDKNGFYEACNDYPPYGAITKLKIIPLFATSEVKIIPMAPSTDYQGDADREHMGWSSSSYMCLGLRILYTRSIPREATWISDVAGNDQDLLPDRSPRIFTHQKSIDEYFTFDGNCWNVAQCRPLVRYSAVCDGVSTSRNVKPCSQCLINWDSKFRWNQMFFSETKFQYVVDGVKKVTFDSTPAYRREAYINVGSSYLIISDVTCTGCTDLAMFAYSVVRFTPGDLITTKLAYKECLKVVLNTGQQILAPTYVLLPAFCHELLYPVCVSDTLKYTAQAGTQCDKCGPSSRTALFLVNQTALDSHPLANPQNDPIGHDIKAAYEDGTLESLITRSTAIPWEEILLTLSGQSIVFAFAEARDDLIEGRSSRPLFTSTGVSPDPYQWTDKNFARWFPYDCGEVVDEETNKATTRCAISKDFCPIKTLFEGSAMSRDQIPSILTSSTGSYCSVPIDPNQFGKYTGEGGPQPDNGDFYVDESGMRVRNINATWTNTGRMLLAPLYEPFNITGSITASVPTGRFRIWMGTISPTYSIPATVEYIMEWMELGSFDIEYTPISPFLAVLGIDFENLQVGSILTMSRFLVSNEATKKKCMPLHNLTYVELPSSVESHSPYHECLFDRGECGCAAKSPFNGPECDWPASHSPTRGKLTCNGYGEPSGGNALTRSLGLATLINDKGVYLDGSAYACKCMDYGLMINTILRPASAFDYAIIMRRDQLPNTPDYVEEEFEEIQTEEKSIVYCNSKGGSLASWNSGDDIDSVFKMKSDVFLVDLKVDEEVGLIWVQRNEAFRLTKNHTTITSPCESRELCDALNWNNLAYDNGTSAHGAVDGKATAVTILNEHVVMMRETFSDVLVEIHSAVTLNQIVVTTLEENVCSQKQARLGLSEYECLFPSVTGIKLQFAGSTQLTIFEIRIFEYLDTSRVIGYF